MDITEVRIKLIENERLLAFASITLDDSFVIRDLKIIKGIQKPFVAMPSRKLTRHCPTCGQKNHLRAQYCNNCGSKIQSLACESREDRLKLYADIAHPITHRCRDWLNDRVINEYFNEVEASKQPGYVCRYSDLDVDE